MAGGSGTNGPIAARPGRDGAGAGFLLREVDARDGVVDPLDHPEELGVARLAGVRQRVRDLAADRARVRAEDDDPVGERDGLLDEVRDEEDRGEARVAVGPEAVDLRAQELGRHDVEGRERLVHAEELRPGDEGPRDPDALLHPARELLRRRALVPREADAGDHVLDARGGVRLGQVPPRQADPDVLLDGEPREEGEALEDERGAGVDPRERRAVREDRPRGRRDQTDQDPQERRLPAARRAEDGDDLSLPDGEVDPVEDDALAPVLVAERLPDARSRRRWGPRRRSSVQSVPRRREAVEPAPDGAVEEDEGEGHREDSGRQEREVPVVRGARDEGAEAEGRQLPPAEDERLGDDRGVPRAPGRRDEPGDEEGEDGRQVERQEAPEARDAVDVGRLARGPPGSRSRRRGR